MSALGYSVTRRSGSHVRLTTSERGQHHVTIPNHDALRLGTISAILADVAEHFAMTRSELVERLFERKA
ncbi:MAG TPA: type II toxin-antitoxin system HicA family toxin [bacterium]|nr:type II toxin-antitoxin system HicA family toxin [bacterium]